MHSFTVEHNTKKKLGVGLVIDIQVIQTVAKDEQGKDVIVPQILNLVIWDNARHISPSVHTPEELTWLELKEEYLERNKEPSATDAINKMLEINDSELPEDQDLTVLQVAQKVADAFELDITIEDEETPDEELTE